jgi:DNA mismatch endonuclease (patch repair protein)
MVVRRVAHALGYRYRLHRYDLPGRPDMVFAGQQKIVFVHGCFWHQHSGCKAAHTPRSNLHYWQPKLTRNVARDAGNQEKLTQAGWQMLVIWECETKDIEILGHKLRCFLGKVKYRGE